MIYLEHNGPSISVKILVLEILVSTKYLIDTAIILKSIKRNPKMRYFTFIPYPSKVMQIYLLQIIYLTSQLYLILLLEELLIVTGSKLLQARFSVPLDLTVIGFLSNTYHLSMLIRENLVVTQRNSKKTWAVQDLVIGQERH